MMKQCIEYSSLKPYWSSQEYRYGALKDLRNPILGEVREMILQQFNISDYYLYIDL